MVRHVDDEHLLQLSKLKPVALPAVDHERGDLEREKSISGLHVGQVLTLLAL